MPLNALTFLEVAMRKYKRGKRLPKQPAARPPIPVERSYLRDLKPYLEAIQNSMKTTVIPALPILLRQLDFNKPETVRNDAVADDLVALMKRGLVKTFEDFTPDEIKRIAQLKGMETEAWNKQVIRRGLKKVVGVDIYFSEPWLNDALQLFSLHNTDLISSIAEDAFYDVQNIVMQGIQAGERWETMADKIEGYVDPDVGKTYNRAKLIARDQVNKLNGNLNQLRQAEIGVRRYVWRTVGDERVRDSHARNDGKIFRWDGGPATGHPGEEINCRCWAEPVLDDLVPGLEDED